MMKFKVFFLSSKKKTAKAYFNTFGEASEDFHAKKYEVAHFYEYKGGKWCHYLFYSIGMGIFMERAKNGIR